jgi:non-heme Fe2+,alpha-ketoglutarate-dependent halogenase
MPTEDRDERDLSYAPVAHTPKTLSTDDVAFYNEQGYRMPFDVYEGDEMVKNRDYFDMLLKQVQETKHKKGSYAINGYHTRCQGLYDIVTDPRILDIVEDIVGPDFLCWGSHFFCKLPGDPKHVAWHQDASYWPLSPARTVTVWLAIDDADVENAAMMFLPKTHVIGHMPWKETKKEAVLGQELVDIEQYGDPVHDVLKAGQISVHADMLAHGSLPNISDRRRCGLTIRYCSPEVVPLDPGWADNAILCRGEDRFGNWVYPPKPNMDDMFEAKAPVKVIGAN